MESTDNKKFTAKSSVKEKAPSMPEDVDALSNGLLDDSVFDALPDFPEETQKKRRRVKRFVWLGALLVVLVAGGVLSYTLWLKPDTAAVDDGPREYIASLGDIRVSYDADGTVYLPYDYIDAEYSAKITDIRVKAGDHFQAGDVLAVLDDSSLQDVVDQRQDAVDNAQKALDNARDAVTTATDAIKTAQDAVTDAELSVPSAENNVRRQELNLQNAQNDVSTNSVKKQQELDSQKATVSSLRQQISTAQTQLSLMEAFPDDYAARDITDQKNNIASLERQLSVAEQNLALLEKQAGTEDTTVLSARMSLSEAEDALTRARHNVEKARDGVDTAYKNVQKAQDNVVSAETALAKAQKNLETAQNDLGNAVLTAPCNGTVIAVNYSVGDKIGAVPSPSTSSSFIIYSEDGAAATAVAAIPELDIASVFEGQMARVVVDAAGDETYSGTVSKLSHFATSGGNGVISYEATVSLPHLEDTVRDRMNCTITYVTHEVTGVIRVPVDALYAESGKSYVDVKLSDGSVEKRQVTTGFSDGSSCEIQSGLNMGETVLSKTLKKSTSSGSRSDGNQFEGFPGGFFPGGSVSIIGGGPRDAGGNVTFQIG